ncbi:hypothetical protein HOB36_01575 [Candidatus Bathyarchaeota archaeon]|nr:hypothetical protein [Candidatus Bathyarchaeota archaeon]
MGDPSFILDGMLGSLARWLRIAGYDSIYFRGLDDNLLLVEIMSFSRIMLTRDRELFQRSQKLGLRSMYLESEEVKVQLSHLKTELGVELSATNSRCPRCNGSLRKTPKADVQDLVPAESFNAFDEFWVCGTCSRAYWKGSHWEKIRETLDST